MRKITTLLFVLMMFSVSHAQVWLELGGKAGFGLTGFFNDNLINDAQHNFELNTAFSFGGVLGLNFGDFHGVNLEALSITNQQSFEFLDLGDRTRIGVEWKAIDVFLMYRFYSQGGAFFELGPKYTSVRSVEQAEGMKRFRVDDLYETEYFSAAAGFGGFLAGSDVFTLKLNIRFEYALQDFVSAQGVNEGYPAYYQPFDAYTETRPFRASIGIEINFGLGGIAQSACGRRRFIMGTAYK